MCIASISCLMYFSRKGRFFTCTFDIDFIAQLRLSVFIAYGTLHGQEHLAESAFPQGALDEISLLLQRTPDLILELLLLAFVHE